MNTNMTGYRWLSKALHHCVLDKSSFSIGRVKYKASFEKVEMKVVFWLIRFLVYPKIFICYLGILSRLS